MKQILLLRHAKSSWDDSGLEDFDRPLAERGRADSPRMGKFLKGAGNLPGHIFSSPARRAKETIRLFAEGAGIHEEIISWNEDLYYGSYSDYFTAIRKAPDSAKTVMLVGHNPKMEETASALCSEARNVSIRMPTAALICFEHSAGRWEQVITGTARLKWMMIPEVVKNL